ncbi:hypothetical protein [Mesorhizobium sp. CN2-181]|uniref:hypothetical protein n=1 Tax=Mesorhizobium yinganensis TaxID=3157707 RepID=UPI0032B7B590
MDKRREQVRAQEDLVNLYLRLNGYFVTKFIVHSSVSGKNKTEMDAIAIRLPHSAEPERVVGPDPNLKTSKEWTDILICEVKSSGQQIRFNKALTSDAAALATVLRWCGAFDEQEVVQIAGKLAGLLSGTANSNDHPVVEGSQRTRVRALLFSPEKESRRPNQPWFINGTQLMEYVASCLAPAALRLTCSTTYDFQAWGEQERIVRYFKGLNGNPPGDIRALYRYLKLE